MPDIQFNFHEAHEAFLMERAAARKRNQVLQDDIHMEADAIRRGLMFLFDQKRMNWHADLDGTNQVLVTRHDAGEEKKQVTISISKPGSYSVDGSPSRSKKEMMVSVLEAMGT